jgi:DNA-binding SARP family transcriptional activator
MSDTETPLTVTHTPRDIASERIGAASVGIEPTVMVRALGSLSVTVNGHDQSIGKPQARSVLAYLLIHLGDVVPTDQIIDELWEGEPPTSALHGLHVAVSTLRRALEPGRRNGEPWRRLITLRPGYMMSLGRDEFDVTAATRLTAQGRQLLARGNPASAETCLIAAEMLFKGPPYAEFAYTEFAQPEIRRLCELHLGVIEDRIDAQLLLGMHHELVPELEYLALVHPSRERFIQQLMTALIRSDRCGDALKLYGEASRRLWVDFGVTPCRGLADLAGEIRRVDTSTVPVAR